MNRTQRAGLKLAAARLELGVITSEALRDVADAALDARVYSPSLAEVATAANPRKDEVEPAFRKALADLDITWPGRDEAIAVLLVHHLTRVAGGTVRPREGLAAMMREVYFPAIVALPAREFVGDSHDLQDLIAYYYGYDDLEASPGIVSFRGKKRGKAVKELDRAVVEEAGAWLQKHAGTAPSS